MRRTFNAPEIVMLAYLGAMSGIVVLGRAHHTWIYLGYHALVAALISMISYAERRFGGSFWRFLRHWMPLFLILGAFREIHYLVPEVHAFDDHASDLALMEIDRKLFGDVAGALLRAWWPPLIEFLHVCYWMYFPLPIALGITLYARGRLPDYRKVATVLLMGFYASYLLYVAVPAVGPHHFETRPEALDGLWMGSRLHHTLLAIEWRMPDAFPSLHVATAGMVLALAWNLERRLFWIFLIPGLGLIASTVILRYHYIIDVVAGLALVPPVVVVGTALFEAWEKKEGPP
jgi:membrane-associated phospholipid phosphatase